MASTLCFTLADAEAPWSLIPAHMDWMIWAVIVGGVAVSIWMEQTYKWAAKVSGPLIALAIAMVLSNVKIMPANSPVYDIIGDYLVPLAVPLLLFKANVFQIVRESGRTFIAFHICVVGTLLGAFIAGMIFLNASLGGAPAGEHPPHAAHAAGIMTGSYTGGGLNFAAVKAEFKADANMTSSLVVADNFIMAGMFAALFVMAGSRFFRRHYPHPHSLDADSDADRNLAAEHWKRQDIGLLDIAKALAIALVITAVAKMLSSLIQYGTFDGPRPDSAAPSLAQILLGNTYVVLTALAVLVATLFHRQLARIHGSQEIGTFFLYIFLFMIGLPADLWLVLQNAPVLFLFCLIIAGVNLVVGLIGGKLFRLDLEEILIAVNATLGGPPSAMAMAISKGWSKLVLPALLVGIWGYVIGTALGVAMTHLLLRVG